MVYLFDKSKTVYEGPFASRSLSDCVNYIGKYSSYTDRGLKLKYNFDSVWLVEMVFWCFCSVSHTLGS